MIWIENLVYTNSSSNLFRLIRMRKLVRIYIIPKIETRYLLINKVLFTSLYLIFCLYLSLIII